MCFGWIDSLKKTIDDEKYMQYFSKRKPRSIWSRINKNKIEKLIASNMMTDAGYASIEIAKHHGSWKQLDTVEALEIPKDLEASLALNKESKDFYESLSKSLDKGNLYWVISAKRPERDKRG